MLFLHGFPEFWYSWRHQLKEFSNDYRFVIAAPLVIFGYAFFIHIVIFSGEKVVTLNHCTQDCSCSLPLFVAVQEGIITIVHEDAVLQYYRQKYLSLCPFQLWYQQLLVSNVLAALVDNSVYILHFCGALSRVLMLTIQAAKSGVPEMACFDNHGGG